MTYLVPRDKKQVPEIKVLVTDSYYEIYYPTTISRAAEESFNFNIILQLRHGNLTFKIHSKYNN
jgi:hypothetical protein